MLVTVTQGNIRRGLIKNGEKCPIALALKYKLHKHVEVGDVCVAVHYNDDLIYEYALPKEAANFVRSFDQELKVKPFTFKLGRGDRLW